MARIKIGELPVLEELSQEESKKIQGGWGGFLLALFGKKTAEKEEIPEKLPENYYTAKDGSVGYDEVTARMGLHKGTATLVRCWEPHEDEGPPNK